MGVKFRVFSMTGGAGGATSFSDDFNRITIGALWMIGYKDFTIASSCIPGINLVGSQLVFSNGSGAGSQIFLRMVPLLVAGNLMGQRQFSEFLFVSNTNFVAAGVAVGLVGDHLGTEPPNGYFLDFVGATYDLARSNLAGTVLQAAVGTKTNGATYAISCEFQTSQNIVRCFKNGALELAFTDSNAARPTTGVPGIFIKAVTAGALQTMDNYRAGAGVTPT